MGVLDDLGVDVEKASQEFSQNQESVELELPPEPSDGPGPSMGAQPRRVWIPRPKIVDEPVVAIRQSDIYPESEVEVESQFINPKSTEMFKEINRDIKLSNLGNEDVRRVEIMMDIIRLMEMAETGLKRKYKGEWELDVKRMWISRLFTLVNSRAAYTGFTARLHKTHINVGVESSPERGYDNYDIEEEYEGKKGNSIVEAIKKWRASRRNRPPPKFI
jgi:hypothetical protein